MDLKAFLHELVEHFDHLTPQIKSELHAKAAEVTVAVKDGEVQDLVNAVVPPAADAKPDVAPPAK